MKKIALFLLVAISGFADSLVLENLTNHKSKLAVQWANSAKEVEAGNQDMIYGTKLNPATMQVVTQSGKVQLTIPKKAEYFRVLAWSKGEGEPDLLTNWVEIIPNKIYKLHSDHLVPAVLMAGTGC